MKKLLPVLLVFAFVVACGRPPLDVAHYWQKSETHSALYLKGEKAQQALEVDISRCVTEIEELVRLGAVKTTITENEEERVTPFDVPVNHRNVYWNVPQRFGYQYVDHPDYHDFDSCMRHKGWKRVAFNSYDTIELSQDTYKKLEKKREGKPIYEDTNDSTGVRSGPIYENFN